MNPKGKTAIVTGGSRGIGKAVARELANEGVEVAIVARGREALEQTAEEIRSATSASVTPLVATCRLNRGFAKCKREGSWPWSGPRIMSRTRT